MSRGRRFGFTMGLVLVLVEGSPGVAAAHGVGGRSDLPVPLAYFLFGAGIVLLVTFGALALLWPEPRLQDGPRLRGSAGRLPGPLVVALRLLAAAWLVLVVLSGLIGGSDAGGFAPLSVWIVFWLVLPFLAALLGGFWPQISPWRSLGRLLRLEGRRPAGAPNLWPAAIAFVTFTWLELVSGDSGEPLVLAIAAAAYTAYLVGWMAFRGVDAGLAAADAFTAYHGLLGAMAPLSHEGDWEVRRRGWLRALAAHPEPPGLVLFVVAMIGTVTYDGISQTLWWRDLAFSLVGVADRSLWFGTLALLVAIGLVGAAYLAACWAAARIGGASGMGARGVARSFAHTLVPIGLAYAVAHYFTLIVFEGQGLLAALSDPFGLGWNLFGTAAWRVNYTWLPPTAVWWVQVAAIVGGHVAGVILAHDRALAVFPRENAVRTQFALLLLMVALTALGLSILAAG